jgi:hypothetical protein
MEEHTKANRLRLSALIFLLAFVIRILFILETMNIPAFRTPNPGMDIDLHWQAARLIVQGATTSEPYFELMMCSTPLHQYWLAFWQVILGEALIAHRLLNALIASSSAVLMFWLMLRLVGNRLIALICSIAWVALPSLIYFDSTLHKSALEIFALLLLIHTLLAKPGSTSSLFCIGKGIVIGILLAILLLLQTNTFLYCIVIVVFIGLDRGMPRKERQKILISAIFIFTSTFMLYQLRGGLFKSKYPWFLPQKGIHFRIGFHKGAHGAYHQLGDIKPWPYGHVFQSRLHAEARRKKTMTPAESDRFFIRESLDFIFNNPGESLKIIATKIGLFFNDYEVKGIDDLYYLKTQSKTLAYTPLGLGVIVLFAGLGVIRLINLREYRVLCLLMGFLAVMLASNVLSFVTWRYRLHNVVPLTLLAAFGLQYLQAHTSELFRSEKPLGFKLLKYCYSVLLPLAICGWIAYRPVLEDYRQGFFKRASYNDKLSRSAEKLLSRLADLERSGSHNPEIIAQKALILNRLHCHTNSYRLLRTVHDEGFYHPFVTSKYLVYLLWLGNYDEAVQLLRDVKSRRAAFLPQIVRFLRGPERSAYLVFIKPHIG